MAPAPSFRIIAYATEAIVVDVVPYDRLTHLNYAFLIPNGDGTFQPLLNPWKLERLVRDAHARGVRVLISVGGWGWDAQFEEMAARPETRSAFVRNLVEFVRRYDLDGADIDWEYPDPGPSSASFLELMAELRAALDGKLLTAAVVAYGPQGRGVPEEAFGLMDFVNIMTYDGPDHGSMEQAQRGLNDWLGRGLEPAKAVLGVPFYSRPEGTPYAKLVRADPAAAVLDEFDLFGVHHVYNGIPTIQAKTRLAIDQAGGIMFWALDHDAPGELSLVEAIYAAAQAP
ncbi:MAG: glycosyl hydrolase family 18 protein [Anaerolineales bacterium]